MDITTPPLRSRHEALVGPHIAIASGESRRPKGNVSAWSPIARLLFGARFFVAPNLGHLELRPPSSAAQPL
jgi:hypothetical protein